MVEKVPAIKPAQASRDFLAEPCVMFQIVLDKLPDIITGTAPVFGRNAIKPGLQFG